MYSELHKRVKKAGQPPGTMIYTGKNDANKTSVTQVTYSEHDFHEWHGNSIQDMPENKNEPGVTWVNVEGVHDVALVEELTKKYQVHPLTVEDILNVEQRPKVEIYDDYIFNYIEDVFMGSPTL